MPNPEFKKLSWLGGLRRVGTQIRSIWEILNISSVKVFGKKNFVDYFLQIIKEKYTRVCKFFGPHLGGRGPLFLTPCLDFKEGSIFEVKNMSYVEDLWGQILIFEDQIRCIGPRKPPGSKNWRARTLKNWGNKFFFLLLYFSLTNKLSFETLFIEIGPQLLLPDPKNPPKNSKGAWEISG
jgi:hypothetical protein